MGKLVNGMPIKGIVLGTILVGGGIFALALIFAVQDMMASKDDVHTTETVEALYALAAANALPTAFILPTIPDTETPTPTGTTTPTPTSTATPTPDMTRIAIRQETAENQLAGVFDQISAIETVTYFYAEPADNFLMVSGRVIVSEGFNTVMVAQALHLAVLGRLASEEVEFKIRIDDGRSESDYLWDKQSQSWQITALRAPLIAPTETSLTLRQQRLVIPSTMRQTNSVPLSTGSYSYIWPPADCAEARAMGLSATQAARWSHLDTDGDGVACYGS